MKVDAAARVVRVVTVSPALVIGLLACSSAPQPHGDPSAATPARVDSPDKVRLDSLTGTFSAAVPPAMLGRRGQFGLSLARGGAREGITISIARTPAGLPEPGRYRLGIPDRADTTARFYAIYHRPVSGRGDTARSFVSISGELVIAVATPDSVRGQFQFTGAEYSASWANGRRGAGTPADVGAGVPVVEVAGTFSASARGPFRACAGTGGPSVMVEVRDEAGRPAARGTTIVIEDGAFRDSVDGARAWDSVRVGAGERRPGRYTVRLNRTGYRPVVLHDVRAPDNECHYAEPSDIRQVRLELIPGAPAVRSVVVTPPAMALMGIPGTEHRIHAAVDAAPGISRAVRWTTSDSALLIVRLADDSSAVVVPQCSARRGKVIVTATSVADQRVHAASVIDVWPRGEMRGLRPAMVKAHADACLAALSRPQRAGRGQEGSVTPVQPGS